MSQFEAWAEKVKWARGVTVALRTVNLGSAGAIPVGPANYFLCSLLK